MIDSGSSARSASSCAGSMAADSGTGFGSSARTHDSPVSITRTVTSGNASGNCSRFRTSASLSGDT